MFLQGSNQIYLSGLRGTRSAEMIVPQGPKKTTS